MQPRADHKIARVNLECISVERESLLVVFPSEQSRPVTFGLIKCCGHVIRLLALVMLWVAVKSRVKELGCSLELAQIVPESV